MGQVPPGQSFESSGSDWLAFSGKGERAKAFGLSRLWTPSSPARGAQADEEVLTDARLRAPAPGHALEPDYSLDLEEDAAQAPSPAPEINGKRWPVWASALFALTLSAILWAAIIAGVIWVAHAL